MAASCRIPHLENVGDSWEAADGIVVDIGDHARATGRESKIDRKQFQLLRMNTGRDVFRKSVDML